MHCVCFNVVCAAEEWTLTLMVLLPVILALRCYSKRPVHIQPCLHYEFEASLGYVRSSLKKSRHYQ